MGRPHRRSGQQFEAEALGLVETSGRPLRRSRTISASGCRRCVAGKRRESVLESAPPEGQEDLPA